MRFFKKIIKGFKSVINTAAQVDKSKGSRFAIFCDIIYCRLRFHANLNEYLQYRFYDYKNCYRKNFLLKYHQVHRYKRVNNLNVTREKYNFYQQFKDLFKREIILAPVCGEDVFLNFVKKHKIIILKPVKGSCGVGVQTLKYETDEQVLQTFHQINYDTVCEEYIKQHKVLSEINPSSVNTLRIVTLRQGDEIEVISATLKMGAKANSLTDNLYGGGIVALVDLETGIVSTFGSDNDGNKYVAHPISKTKLIGLQIPNWADAIEIVKKAHSRLNESKIIGWDIAITQNGVDIVEANSAPSPRVMQIMDRVPRGEKILKVLNNKKYQIYK